MKRDRVLVVLTGAYGNLGDALIRRRALEWARSIGSVYAYVGNAPKEWLEQLGLDESEPLYNASQRLRWLARAFFDPRVRAMMLDPGEVPLRRRDLLPELVLAAATFALRIRGAKVIRPPRGLGAQFAPTVHVHRLACRLSSVTLWRNARSLETIGVGRLVPDTAFAEPINTGEEWHTRKQLLISMRGKRPFPSQGWFDSLRAIASEFNLQPVVITQVREDEQRSREIAEALGAEFLEWPLGSDLAHEKRLRFLYRQAAFVISDRLHVLILCALEGAVPIELVDEPTPKIQITFEQLGIAGVVIDSAEQTPHGALEVVRQAADALPSMRIRIAEAHDSIVQVAEGIKW